MKAKLVSKQVGPYSMNTYIIIDENKRTCAIIDPGGDPDLILEVASGNRVDKILITHGHFDHVLALEEIKQATRAPVYIHPADGAKFEIDFEVPLVGKKEVSIGDIILRVIHCPGHTPGQCSFDLGDDRIIVGDTVFVGGPGRTESPADFETTMTTLQETVFCWPDETEFFPGHGPSGRIGDERAAFEAFVSRGWSTDTHGDVTWI